jgi:hypothetical protein
MVKMLVSSLLKTAFHGDIVVFKNSETPLYGVPRMGLREITIKTPGLDADSPPEDWLREALSWRFRARGVLNPDGYAWMMYLDADCLSLRNPDHLLESGADILVQPEAGRSIREEVFNGYLQQTEMERLTGSGVNAGTLAVRASRWLEVMAEWERIFLAPHTQHGKFRDQTAWNRLLLDTRLRVAPFERGEISFPLYPAAKYEHYRDSAIVHAVGGSAELKVDLLYGLYMTRFYRDPAGLFLNFLEI